MSIADLMEAMAAAGAPMEAILLAVRAIEAKDAEIEARRASEAARTRRYRERGGGAIPEEMRQEVFARDNYSCVDCGCVDHLQCDHINPVSKGGETSLENLQTLCRPCNARKKDRVRKREVRGNSAETERTSPDCPVTPPFLDKETSPRPPKEINPTPRVGIALTRKAAGFGPPEGVEAGQWNEFCAQRKKPLTSTAYAAIVNKLTEAADVGWPPGDVVARSLESGWETVFIPKESRNGNRPERRMAGQPDLRGSRPDPALDLLRAARAAEAAESAGCDWQDHRGAWAALPAIGTG